MLSAKEKSVIKTIARQYKVKKLLLFGSNTKFSKKKSRDIDLAVEGIQTKKFFRFYADLIFSLKKPVDLIDLSIDNKFNRLVRRDGIPVYG